MADVGIFTRPVGLENIVSPLCARAKNVHELLVSPYRIQPVCRSFLCTHVLVFRAEKCSSYNIWWFTGHLFIIRAVWLHATGQLTPRKPLPGWVQLIHNIEGKCLQQAITPIQSAGMLRHNRNLSIHARSQLGGSWKCTTGLKGCSSMDAISYRWCSGLRGCPAVDWSRNREHMIHCKCMNINALLADGSHGNGLLREYGWGGGVNSVLRWLTSL